MGRLDCRTRIFLADVGQQALRMIPQDRVPTAEAAPVDGSVAGEAFRLMRTRVAPGDALWVPMVNGTTGSVLSSSFSTVLW
jgi:hypothetical protein